MPRPFGVTSTRAARKSSGSRSRLSRPYSSSLPITRDSIVGLMPSISVSSARLSGPRVVVMPSTEAWVGVSPSSRDAALSCRASFRTTRLRRMTVSLSMAGAPDGRRRRSPGGEDDVRRLDHGGDLGADGQAELLDRLHRDRGHQAGAARVQLDVGDGLAVVDARDAGRDLVPGAQPHSCYSFVSVLPEWMVLRPYATRQR